MTSEEEIYRRAEAAFGRRHQEELLIEEMAEFIQARNKVLRCMDPKDYHGGASEVAWDFGPDAIAHMIEEFIDTKIMMEQFERFMLCQGISPDKLELVKKEKLDKLLTKTVHMEIGSQEVTRQLRELS